MQGSAVLHPGREERESVLRQHGSCPVRNGGFMKKRDIYGYLIGIGAAELVGLLARLFSGAGDAFYGTLKQPPLAPPGWVFPVAWAILYAMMGAASYLVYGSDSEQRSSALALYAIQLAVNFSWTLVFFRFRLIGAAAAVLILLNVLLVLTVVQFWRVHRSAGILMLPYLLWTLFALYLNLGVWFLNP